MDGQVKLMRGDARNLDLPDNSVDLIVTSPPYFGLRSYQNGGEHYQGQVGDEATPAEFVDALIECTKEMMRVTKPTGSIWVNLGDKYAGKTPGPQGKTGQRVTRSSANEPSKARSGKGDMPQKSLMGIPWRYAIRCIDELGLILRAEVIWAKPNGLPESVKDRVRRSHEQWFHFTLEPRYYSSVDRIREEHLTVTGGQRRHDGAAFGVDKGGRGGDGSRHTDGNPIGKLPGSVRIVATEPLRVPKELGVDHYAAFPTAWPRWIIQGWSPERICTTCGDGVRSIPATVGLDMSRTQARRAHEIATEAGLTEAHFAALLAVGTSDVGRAKATQTGTGKNTPEVYLLADEARAALGGYSREYLLRRPTSFKDVCSCAEGVSDATPGVVLDPFGGTGTTALVASALGRTGISNDMSADYTRIAQWRTTDPKQRAKAAGIKYKQPSKMRAEKPLFENAKEDSCRG